MSVIPPIHPECPQMATITSTVSLRPQSHIHDFGPGRATVNPDLATGNIGVNRDGKEENPASIRCLEMLLRCLQDSSTAPLRLMPAALRFTPIELRMLKNVHDAVTIRYGANTVLSR